MKNKINSLTFFLVFSVFLAGSCLTDVWAFDSDDEEETSHAPTASAHLSAKDTVLWEKHRDDMEMALLYADMKKLSNDSYLKRFHWNNMTDLTEISHLENAQSITVNAPPALKSVKDLPSLRLLSLGWCPLPGLSHLLKLEELRLGITTDEILREACAQETEAHNLPLEDLSNLPKLHTMHVKGHTSPFLLPFQGDTLDLPKLREVHLYHCMAIETLSPDQPETAEVLNRISVLSVHHCNHLRHIQGLSALEMLRVQKISNTPPLHLEGLETLRVLYWVDPTLQQFDTDKNGAWVHEATGTPFDRKHYVQDTVLPSLDIKGNLPSLKHIILSRNAQSSQTMYVRRADLPASLLQNVRPDFGMHNVHSHPLKA
ncbi:MAG: hypothetical protein V6Z78_04420 [Holosporaceae bacterium]